MAHFPFPGHSLRQLELLLAVSFLSAEIAEYADKYTHLLVPDEGAEYDQLIEIDLDKVVHICGKGWEKLIFVVNWDNVAVCVEQHAYQPKCSELPCKFRLS